MAVMQPRSGEKLGWLGGFAGGFLWIPALAVLFLVRGETAAGLAGFVLGAVGYGAVVSCRPWRYPDTRYWRLLILPNLALFAAVPWAIWGFGPEAAGSLDWWLVLPFLALLSPFVTIGWRRWRDGAPEGGQTEPGMTTSR
jgi:hypothetical protein